MAKRLHITRRALAIHARQIAAQLVHIAELLEDPEVENEEIADVATWAKSVVDKARHIRSTDRVRVEFMACLDETVQDNPNADKHETAHKAMQRFLFSYPQYGEKLTPDASARIEEAADAWRRNDGKWTAVQAVFTAFGNRVSTDTIEREWYRAQAWWKRITPGL